MHQYNMNLSSSWVGPYDVYRIPGTSIFMLKQPVMMLVSWIYQQEQYGMTKREMFILPPGWFFSIISIVYASSWENQNYNFIFIHILNVPAKRVWERSEKLKFNQSVCIWSPNTVYNNFDHVSSSTLINIWKLSMERYRKNTLAKIIILMILLISYQDHVYVCARSSVCSRCELKVKGLLNSSQCLIPAQKDNFHQHAFLATPVHLKRSPQHFLCILLRHFFVCDIFCTSLVVNSSSPTGVFIVWRDG